MKTPCAKTGQCADRNAPERICRAEIILHRAPGQAPTAGTGRGRGPGWLRAAASR
ncbi:MAG: hypothetical protein MZU91_06395 [Desulfosudis oleivorans]|nr:hypothetical protein [Desulfosudis oleivorans]